MKLTDGALARLDGLETGRDWLLWFGFSRSRSGMTIGALRLLSGDLAGTAAARCLLSDARSFGAGASGTSGSQGNY